LVDKLAELPAGKITLGIVLLTAFGMFFNMIMVVGALVHPIAAVVSAPLVIAAGFGLNAFARAAEIRMGEPRDVDSKDWLAGG